MVEKRGTQGILAHVIVMLGVLIVAFPLYLAFVASTHTAQEIVQAPMPLLPGSNIVDSYKEHNEEAFVAINARNLLTFGLTYFVVDWYQAQGPLIVFTILGSLFLGVSLLTIPLWYVLCSVASP